MKDMFDRFLCRHPHLYLRVLRAAGLGSVEKRFFLALLRAGDVVFDVGANRGHFTRLFARVTGPLGAVHAFEPGPAAFAMLRQRIEGAGLGNCTLNHFALGEAAGTATLHLPGNDDGQASLRTHDRGSWSDAPEVQQVECRIATLDQYAVGFPRLDFLKCDVEGAELSVIRGGRTALARHLPLLWLESNPEWTAAFGYAPADLIAELRTIGYDTFLAEGSRLAPPEESDLAGNINLLCARKDRHADRLVHLERV